MKSNKNIEVLSRPCVSTRTEQRLFLTDRTHTIATVAEVEVVQVAVFAHLEVEVPRITRIVSVERTRPVVAVGTIVNELTVRTVAGSRQEKSLAVLRRE